MESPPYNRSVVTAETRRTLEGSNVPLTTWEIVEELERINRALLPVDLSEAVQLVHAVIEELKASGEIEESAAATTLAYNWLPPLLRNS